MSSFLSVFGGRTRDSQLLIPLEKRTQCFRFELKAHQKCTPSKPETFGRVLISDDFCPTFQEIGWGSCLLEVKVCSDTWR